MPKKTDTSTKTRAQRRVTYSDIAAALGVSKMTVSYSLRNDPRIPESTRLRVQQKAEEMGYEPDPMLSARYNYHHTTQEKKPFNQKEILVEGQWFDDPMLPYVMYDD